MVGEHTDTNTHGDLQVLFQNSVWHAQCGENLLCPHGGVFLAGHFRQENHEFISAMTADGVRGAHASYQAARYRLQKGVTERMALADACLAYDEVPEDRPIRMVGAIA